MRKLGNNYAFIDAQNIHLGMRGLAWKLDWKKHRIYLEEKFKVGKAFIFIGYLPENRRLYRRLRKEGYELVFKKAVRDKDGNTKANVDADLIVHAMKSTRSYDKAVLLSSDGDYCPLVEYMIEVGKFKAVISASKKHCSYLLRRSAKGLLHYLGDLRGHLEYKKSAP